MGWNSTTSTGLANAIFTSWMVSFSLIVYNWFCIEWHLSKWRKLLLNPRIFLVVLKSSRWTFGLRQSFTCRLAKTKITKSVWGFCFMGAAPHAIATHLNGWLGMKHRATHHPVDNPSELCARYHERLMDMVIDKTLIDWIASLWGS